MLAPLFSLFSALFLGLSCLVTAAPVKPLELLAIAPTITYPTEGVVWPAGSQQRVSWLTSNIPPEAHNYTVVIFLGRLTNSSENLDIKHPLASQVPIMNGTASVTVPSNATCHSDCIVVGEYFDLRHSCLFSCIPKWLVILEMLLQPSLSLAETFQHVCGITQPAAEQLDYDIVNQSYLSRA